MLSYFLFNGQQKLPRPTGKIEIKVKVKPAVCFCLLHVFPKNKKLS
jgi:hypothetical protein